MNKQDWKFSSASCSNSTSDNHLVSLVELLLQAEENFQFCLLKSFQSKSFQPILTDLVKGIFNIFKVQN